MKSVYIYEKSRLRAPVSHAARMIGVVSISTMKLVRRFSSAESPTGGGVKRELMRNLPIVNSSVLIAIERPSWVRELLPPFDVCTARFITSEVRSNKTHESPVV